MASATFEDHPTDPDKVILRKPRYEEDDDIQDYKKPWVGLTEEKVDEIYTSVQEEVNRHWDKGGTTMMFPITLYKAIEQALKEKNA
jgi:hypothetical protein